MSKQDISQQLARLMRENGVSQSGLSRGCGVPQPTINRIWVEKTKEPRRESVVRILDSLVSNQSLYIRHLTKYARMAILLHVYINQMSALRPNQLKRLFAKLSEYLDS